jgi:hypothetical protein
MLIFDAGGFANPPERVRFIDSALIILPMEDRREQLI